MVNNPASEIKRTQVVAYIYAVSDVAWVGVISLSYFHETVLCFNHISCSVKSIIYVLRNNERIRWNIT